MPSFRVIISPLFYLISPSSHHHSVSISSLFLPSFYATISHHFTLFHLHFAIISCHHFASILPYFAIISPSFRLYFYHHSVSISSSFSPSFHATISPYSTILPSFRAIIVPLFHLISPSFYIIPPLFSPSFCPIYHYSRHH